ncbi:MAG: hypothetical protein Phog2KO_19990 [Phototrophicaceae bacterium]
MNQENANEKVNDIMQEGRKMITKANKRHVVIRRHDGTKIAEFSATVVALAVIAMFFFQPIGGLVAIGSIAYGIYNKVKIEVVHELNNSEAVVEVNLPQEDA